MTCGIAMLRQIAQQRTSPGTTRRKSGYYRFLSRLLATADDGDRPSGEADLAIRPFIRTTGTAVLVAAPGWTDV